LEILFSGVIEIMEKFVTVERARELMLQEVVPMPVEKIAITDALGRVVAEDVLVDRNIPPMDNSAMDGYGVRALDTVAATSGQPLKLTVVTTIPAGQQFGGEIKAGETVRIMTGAPIPAGVDAVVKRELVEEHDDHIFLTEPVLPQNDIRYAGEDVIAGDKVISVGQVITPAMVGMMAAVGYPYVSVVQRPRIAIITTGDEIVEFHERPTGGKIRNSNSFSLLALVQHAGGIPLIFPTVRDDPSRLKKVVEQSAAVADLVLTTGGVSMGDYDFVRTVLNEVTGGIRFWKVKMKPGRPLVYGSVNGIPLVGLPGNPVSVMISFEQFVRPMIKKMSGYPSSGWLLPRVRVIAGEDLPGASGRRHFMRGIILRRSTDDCYEVFMTGSQGSGILRSMVLGNCLIVLTEHASVVKKGETVEVELLDYDLAATLSVGIGVADI
jgi:molybdopterin molybdotransferase